MTDISSLDIIIKYVYVNNSRVITKIDTKEYNFKTIEN